MTRSARADPSAGIDGRCWPARGAPPGRPSQAAVARPSGCRPVSEWPSRDRTGRRPDTISYSITPKANWSARVSTGLPAACSGAMYPTVPRMANGPERVTVAVASTSPAREPAAALPRPKSTIFTRPSAVTITFCGFRSRCTMPAAWAAARASATWPARASGLPQLERATPQERSQRLSLDELHHHVRLVLEDADVVDGDDAGVVEGGGDAGLPQQAFGGLLVRDPVGGHELHGHPAVEAAVAGAIHLAHAAFPKQFRKLVGAYCPSRLGSHVGTGSIHPPGCRAAIQPSA